MLIYSGPSQYSSRDDMIPLALISLILSCVSLIPIPVVSGFRSSLGSSTASAQFGIHHGRTTAVYVLGDEIRP